jgi:hypothetical protein
MRSSSTGSLPIIDHPQQVVIFIILLADPCISGPFPVHPCLVHPSALARGTLDETGERALDKSGGLELGVHLGEGRDRARPFGFLSGGREVEGERQGQAVKVKVRGRKGQAYFESVFVRVRRG